MHFNEEGLKGWNGLHLTNRSRLMHFNEEGLKRLADKPRSGKPHIHSIRVASQLIDLAMQKTSSLNYPFELWTLKRLQSAFKERGDSSLGFGNMAVIEKRGIVLEVSTELVCECRKTRRSVCAKNER